MDDQVQESELEKAASNGDVKRLQELVDDAAFDKVSESAALALQAAAMFGQWDAVQYLMHDVGVDVGSADTGGVILQYAAVAGHLDIMKLACAAGADLSSAAGSNTLLSSASTGQIEILHFVIEHGVDLESASGPAALGAAMGGHWEAVKCIIESGASLTTDGVGVQLLALAAAAEQHDIAQRLEARSPDAVLEAGAVALLHLSSTQHWEVCRGAVRYLVGRGVDLGSDAASSAMRTAAMYGDLEMVKCLVEGGFSVSSAGGGEALASAGTLDGFDGKQAVVDYLTGLGAVAPPPPTLVLDEDF